VPYDSRTELVGIVARHADGCPVRGGGACTCGPLGYRAGVWDWQANGWRTSPLVETLEEARAWQRAANQVVEGDPAPTTGEGVAEDDDPDRTEKLFWWAFCYVGLGFVGVALALFASDVAG
jgi:hypothetical protein